MESNVPVRNQVDLVNGVVCVVFFVEETTLRAVAVIEVPGVVVDGGGEVAVVHGEEGKGFGSEGTCQGLAEMERGEGELGELQREVLGGSCEEVRETELFGETAH